MLYPAAGREQNQPHGAYSTVLGPGTVGVGGGGGVLGVGQQEQRPGLEPPGGGAVRMTAASWGPVSTRWEEEAELV